MNEIESYAKLVAIFDTRNCIKLYSEHELQVSLHNMSIVNKAISIIVGWFVFENILTQNKSALVLVHLRYAHWHSAQA